MPEHPRDYTLAVEAGRHALDQQARDLEGARNRAVSLLGIGGLFGAFFGGLTTTSGDRGMTDALWGATAAFVVVAVACLGILMPWPFDLTYNAKTLVGWVGSGADRPQMDRAFATRLAETYETNRRRLDRLMAVYTLAIAALVVEILALAWALRST